MKKKLGPELILFAENQFDCENFTDEFSTVRPGTCGKKVIVSKRFSVPVDINITEISYGNKKMDYVTLNSHI